MQQDAASASNPFAFVHSTPCWKCTWCPDPFQDLPSEDDIMNEPEVSLGSVWLRGPGMILPDTNNSVVAWVETNDLVS